MMLFGQSEPIGAVGAWALMLCVGLLLFGGGLLVVEVARRTADGRTGLNRIAGIRTRATMASPEAWAVAHKAGLKRSVQGGQAMAACAVVAPALGLLLAKNDWDRVVFIWAVAITIGTVLSTGLICYGALIGHRAAKAL